VTPHLIELRDHDLRVRSEQELLARAPGFANIAGKAPVFGDAARRQARLYPREHFNQFWSQLSLDPLAVKNRHFRHAADLAYGQLADLTRAYGLEHGAIIAVPSSWTRAQLAVLLGIVKQCSFKVAGLIDLSVLMAAGSPAADSVILDLQLHQAVLTRLRKENGVLVKESVVTVPYAGLLALQEAWTGLVTEEFIRQSRFDPLHNAETDQFIHDNLEPWIASTLAQDSVALEINLKGTLHQARLTRAQLEQRAQTVYARIAKELAALTGSETVLHVAASQLHLPGFLQRFPGAVALDDEATMALCLKHVEHIQRPDHNLQFITRLPLEGKVTVAAPQVRQPTHVLFNHRALPLPAGRLVFGAPPADLADARVLSLPASAGFSGAIAVLRTPRGVLLELHTEAPVSCNGAAARNGQTLALGDTLKLGQDTQLQFIVVEQVA
jgi:hypothetical protein